MAVPFKLTNLPRGSRSGVYGKSNTNPSGFKAQKSLHGQALGQDRRTNSGSSSYKVASSASGPSPKARPTFNATGPSPKARPTFNGARTSVPVPKEAIRGNPRTAAMVSRSGPPKSRPAATRKGLGARISSALAKNKGNNQAKALARMKKASRK